MTKKQPETTEKTEQQDKEADEKQELIDMLQRLQAEFENYRKRADQELVDARNAGVNEVIKELLPVVDSFELAIKHHNDCKDTELLKGVELIYSQLLSQLERLGTSRISAESIVDPRMHEVYLVEQTTEQEKDNKIIEVLQQGYMRGGTVLRTAKVKAARRTQ